MDKMTRGRVAFAVCGSFCTLDAALVQAERLVQDGWQLIPVMSYAAAGQDTRFGTAAHWRAYRCMESWNSFCEFSRP